jgi:hypothetical protein
MRDVVHELVQMTLLYRHTAATALEVSLELLRTQPAHAAASTIVQLAETFLVQDTDACHRVERLVTGQRETTPGS